MAKQQYSVSENFIRRLRHSHKSQMASMLVLVVGLVGMYMVVASFSPTNYGQNFDRQALEPRGDSLRERIGLRVSDTFNRLNFVVGGKKDNPEWLHPVILPTPSDQVKSTLPDTTVFGDANAQFIANVPEDERAEIIEASEPAPVITEQTQPVATDTTTDPSVQNQELSIGETCVYEKEAEA